MIDIDNTYNPPRWLHHLTSWEVADVQWSPHSARPNWVISTSNQKALLWDLDLPSGRAIEQVIHGHSRAITDINFHSQKPEVLATSSIDSYVHCWDLRDSRKPTQSFADFFSGANQVKWNIHEPHILASSHDKRILVWDDRFNSLPVHTIPAHDLKINGLDFSRTSPHYLLSCSNDHTIKSWDLRKGEIDQGIANFTIETDFPVYRARHTPFGTGCTILPARGGNNSVYLLDITSTKQPRHSVTKLNSVYEFSAHTAPVKEFLWRSRGGENPEFEDRQFQLVTWAKDNDVRFWPVKEKVLDKLHYAKGKPINIPLTRIGSEYRSYHPEPIPKSRTIIPKGSFKVQNQASYGSSPKPPAQFRPGSFVSNPMSHYQKERSSLTNNTTTISHAHQRSGKNKIRKKGPAIMTRSGGPSAYAFNYNRNSLEWLNGVRIGQAALDNDPDGYSYGDHEIHQTIANLGDEISQFHQKFPLITFQKILVSEGEIIVTVNSSAMTLTGEYENTSELILLTVFVKFPPEYPSKKPDFKIEGNYKVSPEAIRDLTYELSLFAENCAKNNMYCLESCMRIILGEKVSFNDTINDVLGINPGEDGLDNPLADSTSRLDSDDYRNGVPLSPTPSSVEDFNRLEISNSIADMKSFARTCGGVWSKTGELVCFFSQPRRPRTNEDMPYAGFDTTFNRITSTSNDFFGDNYDLVSGNDDNDSYIYYSSDGEGSDSSFKISHLSHDPHATIWSLWGPGSRIPPKDKFRSLGRYGPHSIAGRSQGTNSKMQNDNKVRNTIKTVDRYTYLIPARPELAAEYEIMGLSPRLLCQHNSMVAEKYNRTEIANCWRLLEMILTTEISLSSMETYFTDKNGPRQKKNEGGTHDIIDYLNKNKSFQWGNHPFGRRWLIEQLFDYFEKRQDPQMLANMSCILSSVSLYKTSPTFTAPPTPPLFIQIPRHRRNTSLNFIENAPLSPRVNFDELAQINADIIQAASAVVPSLAKTAGSTPTATATATAAAMALQSHSYSPTFSKSRAWYDTIEYENPCVDMTAPSSPSNTKDEGLLGNSSISPERILATTRRSVTGFLSRASSVSHNLQAGSKGMGTSNPILYNPRGTPNATSTNNSVKSNTTTFGLNASPPKRGSYDMDLNLGHMFGSSNTRPISRNSYSETYGSSDANALNSDYFRSNRSSLAQSVRFTYVNEELLDDGESLKPISLLDRAKDSKYKSYRMQYAGILFSWGLQIESLEVLKFNYMINSDIYHKQESNIGKAKGAIQYNDLSDQNLPNAENLHSPLAPIKRQPHKSVFDSLHYADIRFVNTNHLCQFCGLSVTSNGQCFFCLHCEHILHVQCAEKWFLMPLSESLSGIGAEQGAKNTECPSGCGCQCMSLVD